LLGLFGRGEDDGREGDECPVYIHTQKKKAKSWDYFESGRCTVRRLKAQQGRATTCWIVARSVKEWKGREERDNLFTMIRNRWDHRERATSRHTKAEACVFEGECD